MHVAETLNQARRLLVWRGWFNFGATVALASATAGAGAAAIWALGLAPYWLIWAAGLAAAVAAAVIFYQRPPAMPEVALFLDMRCNLQERLSAFIAPGRSVFFSALAADLTAQLKNIHPRQAIGQIMPARASLVAAPLAVLVALILIGAEDKPARLAAQPWTQAAGSNLNASARLALLWRNLQEAKRRYEATHSEADRLAMEQAKKAWEKEMAKWAPLTPGQPPKPAAGDGAASLPAKNGEVALLRVSEKITGKDITADAGSYAKGLMVPDWRELAHVEETIPLAWRPGLRAYFDAIACEALQQEMEPRQGEQP